MLGLIRKNKHQIEIEEFKKFSRFRLVIFLILFLSISGIALYAYYIYFNIYASVNQAKNQLSLDPLLSQEPIDFDKFDKVKKSWEEKNNQLPPVLTRDPFSFNIPTTTPKKP